jgi:hypothetical protein
MRRTTLFAGFAAATLLTGMTFAHAGNPTGPKGPGSFGCGDGDDSGFELSWTPTSVFPPNHKMVAGSLTYTAPPENSSDNLKLTITGILNDEVIDGEEMNGAGNTLVDSDWEAGTDEGTGSVTRSFHIRAERSGRGDGRTYSIKYTATADKAPIGMGTSNDCSGTVTVVVPHDMGGGNDS